MPKSYKRGALYSSGLSFVAKGIAFAQQLCIAYFCGINTTTDIYFYLINLTFLVGGMIQMVTSSILIPRSMELRTNHGAISEMKFLNAFILLVITFGIALLIILGIAGKNFMDLITRFDSAEIVSNLQIFYLFLPVTLLFSLNSVFAEIFVSYKYFTAPVWLNVALNTAIILSTILLYQLFGGFSMMIGALILEIIAVIIMICCLKRTIQWQFFIFDFKLLRSSYHSMGGLMLNQCFVIFISTFPFYLLSQYQVGSVTIVNYAAKLVQAPFALLQQLSIVMQVKLNELNAQSKIKELGQLTKKMSGYIFAIALVIAIGVFLLRVPLVTILYGLGKLPEEALQQIITVIAISILALPFMSFGQVWAKLYFTKQKIKRYIYAMVSANIISCIVYYFLIRDYLITGYAIAFVVAETVTALELWYFIRKYNNAS